MKVDFDAVLTDTRGQPMLVGGESDDQVTLLTIAEQALLGVFPGEQDLPAAEKVRRYKLFGKISAGGAIDVGAEEVTLIKQCIGKGYPTLIVGRAYDLIDPAAG